MTIQCMNQLEYQAEANKYEKFKPIDSSEVIEQIYTQRIIEPKDSDDIGSFDE